MLQTACLFALLVVAAARYSFRLLAAGKLGSNDYTSLYQAGTLAFNYFQFGAVRRGLGGSIAYLLSRDAGIATNSFHLLSAVCVAGTASLLFHRFRSTGLVRAAFALTMIVIMLRWGDDRGRTDMAVAALFGLATIAATRGRVVLAAACVGIGLFVHESSFIFGLPLLAALVLRMGWGGLAQRARLGFLAALAVALVVYLGLGLLPHASRMEMVQVIRGRLPLHIHVEWALYFALSGMRGVETSICQNLNDPTYWTHPLGGLILMVILCAALLATERRAWAWGLLAALPGFIFLSIVANDMSRWAMFACFNIWLIGITAPQAPSDRGRARLVLAVLFLPLVAYRPSIMPLRIYSPSPVLEAILQRLGGPPTPPVSDALDRCDPHWHDVLDKP